MKRIKNLLLKYVTLFLSIFARKGGFEDYNLFIVSTGAFGDSIWVSPALRYIKESIPCAKITLLASEPCADILSNNYFVDRLIVQKRHKIHNISILINMIFTNYSTSLAFFCGQRTSSFFSYLASPGSYYGGTCVRDGTMLTKQYLKDEMKGLHAVEEKLYIAQHALKLPSPVRKYYLEVFPSDKHFQYADSIINQYGHNIVYVHIGASQTYKKWHPDYYKTLINWLTGKGYTVLMSGNEKEQKEIVKISQGNSKIILLNTKNSILYLAAVISKCKFVVTNDTGPMHIASAFNIPIFAFFLEHFYPEAKPYNDGYKKVFLAPFKGDGAESYMSNASPDEVIKSIEKYIVSGE